MKMFRVCSCSCNLASAISVYDLLRTPNIDGASKVHIERRKKIETSCCIGLVGEFEPLQRKRFSALGLVWSVIVECVKIISDKSEI